jgi:hypothetical protein
VDFKDREKLLANAIIFKIPDDIRQFVTGHHQVQMVVQDDISIDSQALMLTAKPEGVDDTELQSKNNEKPCHSERSAASLRISVAWRERFFAPLRMTKIVVSG